MDEQKLKGWGRRIIADITPLRGSPSFRWLYLGSLAGVVGRQITVVAVPYQLYVLTGSTLAVGLLGMVQLGPLLIASLAAGTIVDAFDRRRILLASQVLLALTALGLAVNAFLATPLIWPLYVLSAFNAGISALDSSSRMSMVPALVDRDNFPAAMALQQIMNNAGNAVVPAVAGLLLARASIAAVYLIEAGAFGAAVLMVYRLPSLRPEGGGRRAGLASIAEGLRFLQGHRLIQASFLIDINAMVFSMPRALFPAIGTVLLGGDAATVGLLHAAPGVGALLGATTSGWVSTVRRKGRAVVMAVVLWGMAITLFGLVDSLPLALVALAVAGSADVVSAVFRSTIIQLSIPDSLRGRISAIHIAVVSGGPRLGDAQAGALAAATSVPAAVVMGGAACVLGAAAIKRFMPELWDYGGSQPSW